MENKIEPATTIESTIDREIADQYKNIPGWGMDADPKNNPTYPMKHYTGADHERLNYEKPVQQPLTVEVLQSIERPGVSRVFGTSTPPQGLSGALRRYAFRYSESTYAHWVPLVVADRIGVVEGLVDDIRRGHVPNIFAEKGLTAEWKYNREKFFQKILLTGLAVWGVAALLSHRKKA
jgi:hypothetical protein